MDGHCIGIVGGLGPYAGLDLVKKLFDSTRAIHDQDHVRVMLHSFPGDIPVRPEFLLGLTNANPGHAIGDIMVGLARAGADIIAMPCNTAHSPRILNVALKKLYAEFPHITYVHIITSALAEISRRARPGARVGLMGTVATLRTRLYQDALEALGFTPVLLNDEGCQKVQEAISNDQFGIKAASNPVTPKAKEILLHAAQEPPQPLPKNSFVPMTRHAAKSDHTIKKRTSLRLSESKRRLGGVPPSLLLLSNNPPANK